MQAIATLFALLAFLHSALAGVYITAPVATTVGTGGQVLNVAWADDGKAPTVAQVGVCSIDLYTGSVDQQTWLQNIAASVDVSKASSASTTIQPGVGQSGNYYFIRFTSAALKSTVNPQYPYQAFSAKFTLNSMTGTWNSTVLAQLSASTASASGSSVASITSASASASKSASGSVSAAAAATTSKSAAGQSVATPGLMLGLVALAGYYAL